MNSILSKNQVNTLEKIGKNKFITGNFYLTGGTALAEFYLKHRYSEDLDFFSEQEVDILSLFIKVQEAKDYPRMIKKLDANVWRNFFVEEAKKLSPEIIK